MTGVFGDGVRLVFAVRPDMDPLSEFRARSKHILILTTAGKPVYSRHSSPASIAALSPIVQAVLSRADESGDPFQSLQNSDGTLFVALTRAPFIFCAVSRTFETPHSLRAQLSALHAYLIFSTLPTACLHARLAARPGLDVRPLIGGATPGLSSTIRFSARSPSLFLDAFPILPLPSSALRARALSALTRAGADAPPAAGDARLLYTLLVAGHSIIAWAAPSARVGGDDFSLRPLDAQCILTFTASSGAALSRGGSDAAIPIALPGLSATSTVLAYISCLTPTSHARDEARSPESATGIPQTSPTSPATPTREFAGRTPPAVSGAASEAASPPPVLGSFFSSRSPASVSVSTLRSPPRVFFSSPLAVSALDVMGGGGGTGEEEMPRAHDAPSLIGRSLGGSNAQPSAHENDGIGAPQKSVPMQANADELPAPQVQDTGVQSPPMMSAPLPPPPPPPPFSNSVARDRPAGVYLVLVVAGISSTRTSAHSEDEPLSDSTPHREVADDRAPIDAIAARSTAISRALHSTGVVAAATSVLANPGSVGGFACGDAPATSLHSAIGLVPLSLSREVSTPLAMLHYVYVWKPARQWTSSSWLAGFSGDDKDAARRRKSLLRAFAHVFDAITAPVPLVRHYTAGFSLPADATEPPAASADAPVTVLAVAGLQTSQCLLLAAWGVLGDAAAAANFQHLPTDKIPGLMEKAVKTIRASQDRLLMLPGPGVI